MCDQNDSNIKQSIDLILSNILDNVATNFTQEQIESESSSSSDQSFDEIKIKEYLQANQDEEEEEGEISAYEKFKTKHEEIKKPELDSKIPEKKEERYSRFSIKQEDIDTIPFEIIGYISSIVLQEIVIKSTNPTKILNLSSLLFLDKGKHLLGAISDVFGQISSPYYLINCDSYLNQLAMIKELVVGDSVIAFSNNIGIPQSEIKHKMQYKGCDASNKYDEELLQNEQDYSDDEKERMAKARRNHKNDDAFQEKQMKKKLKRQQKRQSKQNEQQQLMKSQGNQVQYYQQNPRNKFCCPQNANLIYSNWNPQPYQQQQIYQPQQQQQQQLNQNYNYQQQNLQGQFMPNYQQQQQYPNYQGMQQQQQQQQGYWQNQQQMQPQLQQLPPQRQGINLPPYQNIPNQYYQN